MKRFAVTHLLFFIFIFCSSAQPTYYYYDPANAGVNNLYFNTLISYKFLFIYTQAELASTGMTGPVEINSIWLKSNTAYNLDIQDIKITLGHSTLSVPVNTFASNFDTGSPAVVLDETLFNYSMAGAPWNDPPADWSEIPLTTSFIYNFSDNLAIQFEYSGINYPIPLYANNGGMPITVLTDVYDSLIANSSTARMMIGFSTSPLSPVAFSASDDAVCQKFCVDFTDFSVNNPTQWQWNFEGGSPSSSADQNPANICYNLPGTFDVTLITTNLNGSDTLSLPDYITVYATPPFPSITQAGYTLTSSVASSYQWQLDASDISGATNQSYNVLETGLYTVIVGDSNGCVNSASKFVLITGIDDVMIDQDISIFPNPSKGSFMIEITRETRWNGQAGDEISIDVINTLGQKILSSEFPAEVSSGFHSVKKQIDLTGVAQGVYFIEINTAGFSLKKKILITF